MEQLRVYHWDRPHDTFFFQIIWRFGINMYGPEGSPSRGEFEAKAKAWYYAKLLRDERKRQKLTQQQLGERIGKKREYISSLEQGQTDMQLSTFMLIANALGLRFSLVVG